MFYNLSMNFNDNYNVKKQTRSQKVTWIVVNGLAVQFNSKSKRANLFFKRFQ